MEEYYWSVAGCEHIFGPQPRLQALQEAKEYADVLGSNSFKLWRARTAPLALRPAPFGGRPAALIDTLV